MPRLHEFIREHTEEILAEWETFARTLPIAESMDVVALRDHAKEMLLVVARDLETAQTARQASDKSMGRSDASESGKATAAQEHGSDRAGSGFTIAQMLAELRALRASVLRLWGKHSPELAATGFDDMMRFNEAIDQAIAESALQYSLDLAESKDRFLAILGHDLRNPIGAITMSASFILETGNALTEQHRMLVSRIANSGRRMNDMVNDLLDFTRIRFGDTIPITPADMDASRLIRDVVTEVASRYPDTDIDVEAAGEVRGKWDYARLTQALTNLVANAVQHGDKKARITVAARGTPEEALISVQNTGPVIPKDRLRKIFELGPNGAGQRHDEHLGLGLYIVDKIVAAHAGKIDVRSTESDGTVFTIHLPRAA